jgi:hypothetical protein
MINQAAFVGRLPFRVWGLGFRFNFVNLAEFGASKPTHSSERTHSSNKNTLNLAELGGSLLTVPRARALAWSKI